MKIPAAKINKTAKELYLEYSSKSEGLISSYCNLKDRYPYEQFPKLGMSIWRCHTLVTFYKDLMNIRDYKRGG